MRTWPKYPAIFEINTWVWLRELDQKYQKPMDLATVPEQEWDAIAAHGFDAVWFMGVWERSPAGIRISMRNTGLLEDFKRALPDFSAEDNVGSPYCVRRYVVDEHLVGADGVSAHLVDRPDVDVVAVQICQEQRHAVGLANLVADQFAHANVWPLENNVPKPDLVVDANDAKLILQKRLGLINF